MSKQIKPEELAAIVTKLLTQPEKSGELDSFEAFQGFMTDIGQVICNYCGGEIRKPAEPLEDIWYLGVHGNEWLPSAFGGIWRDYDTDGELFDEGIPPSLQASSTDCSPCGSEVTEVIGAPDGAELCGKCFDAGAH